MSRPKVALIAGAAHGGTTISNMVLGQHPEIFATGKLRGFPQGGMFSDKNICSCGDRAAECRFWTQVRERFLPYQDLSDEEKIPVLYRLISELSGRRFVGDVTHSVEYAQLLQAVSGIDLYLVHLVRDGRGVVFSRIRKDLQIGVLDGSSWQRFRRVARVSRRWSSQVKQLAKLEEALGPKAVRVNYEDICKDPRAALAPVGACLGLDFGAIGESLGSGQPFRHVPHMLRGNVRLRARSDVVLRRDTAYLEEMPWIDQVTFQIASRLGSLFQ